MEVALIIHTRTFNQDFDPKFKVRPSDFTDRDIQWARKFVIEATSSIDSLQGERWVVVDNEKYCIAGIVTFLKKLYEKCDNLSETEKENVQELFCDEKGRPIYAFIGFVIKSNERNNVPNITYNILMKNYFEKIYPIWKRTYQESILTEFTECNEILNSLSKPTVDCYSLEGKELYESNLKTDYELFKYYLSGNSYSFCSNINDFNMIKKSSFAAISTSINVITRIKREDNNSLRNTESLLVEENNVNEKLEDDSFEELKKKSGVKRSPIWTKCLIILGIIILLLKLLSKIRN